MKIPDRRKVVQAKEERPNDPVTKNMMEALRRCGGGLESMARAIMSEPENHRIDSEYIDIYRDIFERLK